jgi:hypothetical protein
VLVTVAQFNSNVFFAELITTLFINETKRTAIQNHKTITVGLNTLMKNDLKFICFINLDTNDLSSLHNFCHDFSIHHNNTANGDKMINIHKYIILIKASTHNTSISIANIIVVHH